MPLIKGKSKKAFEENLKAELEAGKPKDQSLAIAYNIRKKARRKMMADGGEAESAKAPYMDMMDEGGEPKSIAEAIMRKKAQHLAEGGEVVDLNEDATEAPAGEFFHEQNEDAAKKELYDVDQVEGPAEEYNPHGSDDSEMDAYDMVDRIRARLRSIRGR